MAAVGRLARRRATMSPPGNASVTSAVTVYRPAWRTISWAAPGAAAIIRRTGASSGARVRGLNRALWGRRIAAGAVQRIGQRPFLAGEDGAEVHHEPPVGDPSQDGGVAGAQSGGQPVRAHGGVRDRE